jgi:hypothetical protein
MLITSAIFGLFAETWDVQNILSRCQWRPRYGVSGYINCWVVAGVGPLPQTNNQSVQFILAPLHISINGFSQHASTTNMKLFVVIAAIASLALASPATKDPYPAPCGRSDPSGICTTKPTCAKMGGFYVQRDCTFYNVLDIGCCYDIPDQK